MVALLVTYRLGRDISILYSIWFKEQVVNCICSTSDLNLMWLRADLGLTSTSEALMKTELLESGLFTYMCLV